MPFRKLENETEDTEGQKAAKPKVDGDDTEGQGGRFPFGQTEEDTKGPVRKLDEDDTEGMQARKPK